MPKTRDELCKHAIHTFMSNSYDIEYNLVSLTKNKSIKLQCYDIKIPRQIKLYDVDEYSDNGVHCPARTVYRIQEFTEDILEIDTLFNNYFNPYILRTDTPSSHRYAPSHKSSLQITVISIDNEYLIAHIQALYCNNHHPYPIESTSIPETIVDEAITVSLEIEHEPTDYYIGSNISENMDDTLARWSHGMILKATQLEFDLCNARNAYCDTLQILSETKLDTKYQDKYNRLKMLYDDNCQVVALLENDNRHYKQRYNKIKTECTKLKSQHVAAERLSTIITQFYKNTNTQEDCPVCYDNIIAEKLVVPMCGHFICSTCSKLCNCCPICRLEYI